MIDHHDPYPDPDPDPDPDLLDKKRIKCVVAFEPSDHKMSKRSG